MKNIITSVGDCDVSLISVKKPYQVSQGIYVFDIAYNKEPLLIQTPICTVPYSYSIFDNNAFKIDIVTCVSEFFSLLEKVHQHIINKINTFNPSMLETKQFINYTKEVNDDEIRIRLKNTSTHNILAFDRNSAAIPVSSIQSLDKVVCLYQLQRVVVQKDLYVFSTCLIQMKRLNIGLKTIETCLIKTSEVIDAYGGIDLTKYNKMKHMGIPVEAIEHKMTMDGLKKECIKYWVDFQNLRLPPPTSALNIGNPMRPPPPPPLPPKMGALPSNRSLPAVTGKPEFLKDIMSSNFRLKKVEMTKTEDKIVSKLATKFKDDFGYAPPTLQDILNARTSLRKVSK